VQHTGDAGVARGIFRPAAVSASRLGLDDSLRLSAAAVLVASNGGKHIEHHGVETSPPPAPLSFLTLVRITPAASYSSVRVRVSPHLDIRPLRSTSPD
jgi:hypothetical protein